MRIELFFQTEKHSWRKKHLGPAKFCPQLAALADVRKSSELLFQMLVT